MAWRMPTRDDLTARLSQREQEAFSRSAEYSIDIVENVIAQAVAFARDAVRSGARAKLAPQTDTIPEGMFRPVLSIAIMDILNRFAIQPSEARREAAKTAEAYLTDIAAGKIVPESYNAEDALEAKAPGPQADDGPRHTLGGGLW